MPSLEPGDRLSVNAELQVTTDCLEQSPRCVGHVYHYAPRVSGTIALLDAETGESSPIARSQRLRCLQRRPDRQHHCVLTFPSEMRTLVDPAPCVPGHCSLVLEVSATNQHAHQGDRLVIGSNRPNGSISTGHARLGLIRIPRQAQVASEQTDTTDLRHRDLPLALQQRSVLSLRLPHLRAGEHLAVDGSFLSDVRRVRMNALVSSKLILAESPGDTRSRGLARRVAGTGEISPSNGSNCTLGQSPCATSKAGVVAVRQDAREQGERKSLYLNLVVRAKPKFNATGRLSSATRLRISDGELSAVSYEQR